MTMAYASESPGTYVAVEREVPSGTVLWSYSTHSGCFVAVDGWLWVRYRLGPDGWSPAHPGSLPEGRIVNESVDRGEHDRFMSAWALAQEVLSS